MTITFLYEHFYDYYFSVRTFLTITFLYEHFYDYYFSQRYSKQLSQ